IVLKGRREPLRVYELLPAGGAGRPEVMRYARAFAALGANADRAPLAAFAAIAVADPHDGCARFWSDRIAAGETSPVVVMADK
ncbi:hypothetical protein, partial [Acidisphaera rubrifaciens]|uniref:hypothetical protein n=1 Tax=Acidisphaera rubrifaciens TaxID=50715 RepID=UPI0006629D2B